MDTSRQPTPVACTDEMRAAAEYLRDLGTDQIAASDDPLTLVRNLHATLNALRESWPAITEAAGFNDGDEATADFVDDINRGLKLAVDGLWTASNSI